MEGDVFTKPDGYVMVKVGEKWMFQQIHVMEIKLGRKLLKGERVHHKNGIRGDNRPTNLELWFSPHPSGQRIADLFEDLLSDPELEDLPQDVRDRIWSVMRRRYVDGRAPYTRHRDLGAAALDAAD